MIILDNNGETLTSELESLFHQIRQGRAGLFVGAGMSKLSGGPLANELVDIIHQEFPDYETYDDLLELCDEIILDKGKAAFLDIFHLVKKELDNLKPENTHTLALTYDWAGVYTTNYDDLLEQTYDKLYSKDHRVIVDPRFEFNLENKFVNRIYKLMGDINSREEDHSIIISESDLKRNYARRESIFQQLISSLKGGPILFIGYSFNDMLIFDLLREIAQSDEKVKIPNSYALFRSERDEKLVKRLARFNVSIIVGEIDQFFKLLHREAPPIEKSYKLEYPFSIYGENIYYPPLKFETLNNVFDILYDHAKDDIQVPIENFFNGKTDHWSAFKLNYDFIRKIYSKADGIWETTSDILNSYYKQQTEAPTLIVLKGSPGAGKTIVFRRLGYDIYYELGIPVIILKSTILTFKDELYDYIYGLIQALPVDFPIFKVPIVFMVDQTIVYGNRIGHVIEELHNDGLRILTIVADRTNEWGRANQNNLLNEDIFNKIEFEIPLEFEEDEFKNFVKYLERIGYGEFASLPGEELLKGMKSFFVSLYHTINPSKESLEAKIIDHYSSIGRETRFLLEKVATINSFGVSVPVSLLYEFYSIPYSQFEKMINSHEIDGVLFYETIGRYDYVHFHHRLIAEILISNNYSQKWFVASLIEMMSKARLWEYDQITTVESILVNFLSSRHSIIPVWDDMDLRDRIKIFEATLSKNYQSRIILHHLALLYSRLGKFRKAIELMQEALSFPPRTTAEDEESVRYEGDQIIHNSLATVFARLGYRLLSKNKKVLGNQYFARSMKNFELARKNKSVNQLPVTYHAEAIFLCLKMLNYCNTDDEKLELISKGINLIGKAYQISQYDPSEKERFLSTFAQFEAEIIPILGDNFDFIYLSNRIYTAFDSYSGFLASLSIIYRNLNEEKIEEEEIEQLRVVINTLLEQAESNFGIISDILLYQLKFEKMNIINKLDEEEFFNELIHWYSIRGNTVDIKMEALLGELYYRNGLKSQSDSVYGSLRPKIRYHPKKYEIYDSIFNANNELQSFDGVVTKIPKHRKDIGFVDTKINDFRMTIAYRFNFEYVHLNVKDKIQFNIGFALMGPYCINIEQIE